jgi:hypothetical protein
MKFPADLSLRGPYIHSGRAMPTKMLAPADIGFPDDLAKVVTQLAKLDQDAASAQLVTWMRGNFGKDLGEHRSDQLARMAVVLVHLALTDESWAAARALVDVSKDLNYTCLAYGMAILGLDALPRLVEAHDAKKITKQARWQYRQAIVAALAVAASRKQPWPAEYDRFLAIDPSWWFHNSQSINGNWHNDLMLSLNVTPFLRIAIAALPKPRAHAILDAALDEVEPKRFPMCFFALPLLAPHWRADYLPRVIRALNLGEDALEGTFIDSTVWQFFSTDLIDLELHAKVLLERYKTGHSRHIGEMNGMPASKQLYKQAKKLLPAPQFARFESNYQQMFGE